MRRAIVLSAALAACHGGDDPAAAPPPPPPRPAPNLPRLDDAKLVIAPLAAPQPAAFVWVGTDGKLATAATGPKWTGEPPTARTPVDDLEAIRRKVLEAAVGAGGPIRDAASDQLGGLSSPDPLLARRQAIDQARRAGILGTSASSFADHLDTVAIVPVADMPTVTPLVLTAPKTPARPVAQVLLRTGGMIGVARDGKPGILNVGFAPDHGGRSDAPWIEIHPDGAGLHVLLLPGDQTHLVPWKGDAVDRDALRDAITVYSRAWNSHPDIDVLVGDDTTAQQLVELVAALQGQGKLYVGERVGTIDARVASYGSMLSAPKVAIGIPNANGDLDKAIIRRYVKRNIQKIQYCYEKRLLVNPHLDGTLQTQLFIDPTGHVASAVAHGVDPEVATCVAEVIKGIEFPAPKGGGGVQVNYPFTFRPSS